MQKIKRLPYLIVIVALFFVTGITFYHVFATGSMFNNAKVLGEEADDDSEENDSRDDESNEDEDENDEDNGDEADQDNEDNEDEDKNDDEDEQGTVHTRTSTQVRTQEVDDDDEVNEQDGDNNDVQEEIADINKEMTKIEAKIAPLATTDPKAFEAFNASLMEIKTLIAQLDTTEDPTQLEALVDTINHKMERLDKMMDLDEENDDADENDVNDDEDVAKEYKNTVAQFVHTLKTVDETDTEDNNGIGEKVRVVAQAQNDSQTEVEESINEVESRGGFVRFLIGPKYRSITEIQAAIAENQTRIKILTDLMAQVTDPAVKLVLQDQITSLNQQNAKLQIFVANIDSGFSLFGWLIKMFS